MEDLLTKMYEYVLLYGLNFLWAVVIFAVGRRVARWVTNAAEVIMLRTHLDKTLVSFLKNMLFSLAMAFVIIAALNRLGVETTSLITVVGAAGLAVGLALQGSLGNFAGGVILILLKPFKVGDFVQAGGTQGTVEEILIFNTVISTPDNRREIVPNMKITSDTITNFTAIEKRRIDLVFGISYGDDIKKAKDALMKVVTSDPRVLKDPAPVVAVSQLGDSSVNLVCRPWVKPSDYWDVYFSTVERGKEELEKAGITIPFPQRDVHLYQEKEKA